LQAGPIIERVIDQITRSRITTGEVLWDAVAQGDESVTGVGPTPLIAAMRCYVASKLGEYNSMVRDPSKRLKAWDDGEERK
jgi:hypothetical protein